MPDFSSYRAAAAFARLRAKESLQSAKIERNGERWLVHESDDEAKDALDERIAVARDLIRAEIEETRAWLAEARELQESFKLD